MLSGSGTASDRVDYILLGGLGDHIRFCGRGCGRLGVVTGHLWTLSVYIVWLSSLILILRPGHGGHSVHLLT